MTDTNQYRGKLWNDADRRQPVFLKLVFAFVFGLFVGYFLPH